MVKQVSIEGSNNPIIRFEVSFQDENLINKFRKDPKELIGDIQDAIINLAKFFDRDFEEIYKKKMQQNEFKGIHIIPYENDGDWLIPIVENFTKDLTKDQDKIFRYKARFLSLGLERALEFEKMAWQCLVCGNDFETYPGIYRNTREKYQTPKFCNNKRCKAKGKYDFRLIPEKSIKFEKRTFTIIDLENKEVINEIKCYISQNINYFTEKAKNIRCNDEIEVLGILKTDTADVFSSKEEQQLYYYIDVIDFNTGQTNDIDPKIIKRLRKKLKKEPLYCNNIIDSIHPYSQNIMNYFPIKLLYFLSFITSNSYTNIRNGINSVVGGHSGTLKSKIANEFNRKLGPNNFGIIYGKATTSKGLVPVAQRNNNEKNLVKRYGAIPYYNKKTFIVDEAHYLYNKDPDALECFKCFEEGKITRALDGTTISAPAEGTVILSLNYQTDDEAYDFSKNLVENLGFPEDQKSVLDRFDLHYRIPRNIDKIVEILVNRGDDSYKPKSLVSDEEIFNYSIEAKRLYTEGIKIPKEILEIIKQLYNAMITEKRLSKKIYILNPREAEIIKKMLKGISAMRLRSVVNEDDLEYLKKFLMNTMIPFQDNNHVIQKRIINENEVFLNAFELLTEIHDDHFYIAEFIEFLRGYLESNYFEQNQIGLNIPILGNFIDKENNLTNNKFRKLLDNNQEKIEDFGYIIDKINNKTSFINIKWLNQGIREKIMEIFKDNAQKTLEIKGLLQILEIELGFSEESLTKCIDFMIKNKILEEIDDDKIRIK